MKEASGTSRDCRSLASTLPVAANTLTMLAQHYEPASLRARAGVPASLARLLAAAGEGDP